jgi:uncharacterized protein
MALCVEAKDLEALRSVLSREATGISVKAFGSRVSGVNLTPSSDLDLALSSDRPIPVERMAAMEKAFASSGLPYRIDLVDWAKLPAQFQKKIEREHIVIQ